MFWTDCAQLSNKIERASMDGDKKTRRVIAQEAHFVSGLTVDYQTNRYVLGCHLVIFLQLNILFNRIFWFTQTGNQLNDIHVSDFEGENRGIIFCDTKSLASLPFLLSMTLARDVVYWTDVRTHDIQSCNIKNGVVSMANLPGDANSANLKNNRFVWGKLLDAN